MIALIAATLLVATGVAARPADAAMVASGGGHSCAIARSGSVLCWGANASGQLGDGSNTATSKPVVVPTFVPGSSDVTSVATGASHSCAVMLDGTVMCWGENASGQLGDGSTSDSSAPVAVSGVSNVVKVAAGLDFTCALIADGNVDCWGEGSSGQLGNGAGADSLTPVVVSGSANASDLVAGDAHACVIASGSVRCWGANASGQLGDGSTNQANAPVTVSGVSGATRVAAGSAHGCAVTATNVKCWGANGSGQLGDGTTVTPRTTAVTVIGLSSPSNVAAGAAHSCALDATPAVKCWGAGSSGQLGNGGNSQSSTPVAVSGLTTAASLSASANHTCALDVAGSFNCWGAGANGEIGDGGTSNRNASSIVINAAGGKLMATGASHSCVALSGGKANCWGLNGSGQLGDASTSAASTPVVAYSLNNLASISAGTTHTCAVEVGGQAKCWGANAAGQLGIGAFSPSYSNLAGNVSGLSNAVSVDSGANHNCALTTAATVKCWGQAGNYQLGNGSTSNSNVPVSVTGLSNAIAVSAGGNTSCTIVSGGQAKCWGNNASGQVGQGNTTTPVTAPANVSGVSTATAIASGPNHACAVLADTTVKCWGDNQFGQVGDGTTTTPRSTPVSVTGLSGVKAIAVGDYHSCAIVAFGAIKCWGYGANGRLGNSGTSNSSLPVDVTGMLGAVSIAAGAQHTCAVVDTGRTYCWGYGLNSQLGNGSTSDRTAPVESEKVLEGLVSITAPLDGAFTQSTQPNVDFSTIDVVSPLQQCNLDSGGWSNCSFSPYTPAAPLSVGRHTMQIRAAPSFSGNDVISYTNLSFVVSVVLPTASISAPVDGTVTNDSTPTVTFGATGQGTLTIDCRADSGAWSTCTSPWTTTSLADGVHNLQVRVTDTNTNVAAASVNVTVDTIAPNTSITANPPSTSNTSSPSFSFSSSEGGGSFECHVDAAAWSSCGSPDNLSGLSEGSHTFYVRATDAAGNTDATPASYGWSIDLTAPNTSITSSPSNPTGSTSATFAFSATETATYECQIDGGGYTACTSPKTLNSLAGGSHTFNVRATDTVGNTDASPAAFTWTIDTTPPNTNFTATPPAVVNSASASFSFNATESATFECRLDGAAWSSCGSPRNLSGLTDASHTFDVRATDTVGNVDPTPATYTWTVDTAPPDTSITSSPPTLANSSTATFNFSANETSGFECRIDGGAFSSCSAPKSYLSLAEGAHSFSVRAVDVAGNTDATPASYAWTVDTAAPDTSITANPPSLTNSTSASFSFSATETATFQCRLDGAAWSGCASPQSYSSLATGAHTFDVRAIDTAGNIDATPAGFAWTIDTVVPNTSITANPSNPTNSTSASFSFSATETATFECRLDGGAYGACSSPQAYSSLSAGSHTFDVRATDTAGNTDASPASFTWTVDLAPPDTSITANPSNPTNSTSASFSFSATETATYQCRIDGGAYGACTSPRSYSSLAAGSHTFDVRATDTASNTDASPATFTWTIDLTPPDTSITANPPSASASANASFSFSATETSSYQCRIDGGAYGACVSPQSYSALAEGAHTFYVRATDAAGNTDASPATYTWTIDTTFPDTSITANPAAIASSTSASFSFSATETVTYQCQLDGGGYGACTSPRAYSSLAEGAHSFQVRATDTAGNTDATPATYSWTIDTTLPNVQITAPTSGSTLGDTTPSISFNATDANGVATVCRTDAGGWSACGSPYTTALLADGTHSVQVRASDPAANLATATVNFTIDSTFPTVSISAPTAAQFTSDSTPALSFSATGTAPLSTDCRVDGGAWAACATGGSLAALADGSHTVTVRVTDGLARVATVDQTFTVDTVAPTIGFTAPASGAAMPVASVPVSFTTTDATAVTATCSVDGGAATGCSSPFTTGVLTEGSHTVAVALTDAAGNTGGGSRGFSVDLTAPVVSIGSPADGSTVGTAAATVSFTSSDASAVTHECSVDGGAWLACVSPYSPTLTAGSHSVGVRATDAAGHNSSDIVSFTFAPPSPPAPGDSTPAPPTGPQIYKATLGAKKKGAKIKLTLKLTPPTGVTAACAGTVSFSGKLVKAKVKGVAVPTVSAGACVAMKSVKVKRTLKGKLKLTANFPGSAQIAAVKLTKTIKVK